MKSKLALVLAAFFVTAAAHAAPKVLPDACGAPNVKFDIKTSKTDTVPAPDPAKAQIVFILSTPHNFVTRFGIDGAWVGANKSNSYFIVWVTPGEHHLCAATDHYFGIAVEPGMATVTAEAGKVYYAEEKIDTTSNGGGMGTVVGGPAAGQPVMTTGQAAASGSFALVSEDEGKFRMKASQVSTSTPKK